MINCCQIRCFNFKKEIICVNLCKGTILNHLHIHGFNNSFYFLRPKSHICDIKNNSKK